MEREQPKFDKIGLQKENYRGMKESVDDEADGCNVSPRQKGGL
jgi:hypothetical protein